MADAATVHKWRHEMEWRHEKETCTEVKMIVNM